MRNHYISVEINSRVIVTQTAKIWKKAHLYQKILAGKNYSYIYIHVQVQSKEVLTSFCLNLLLSNILFPIEAKSLKVEKKVKTSFGGGMGWN